MDDRQHGLTKGARLALFIVSYSPLFLIMTVRQLYTYKCYLNWGGLSAESIFNFLKYFGAISILIFASLLGAIGLYLLLKNVHRRAESSGTRLKIIDIENKNSESITYLFTYLIPFVFQDLSGITDVFSVFTLLIVTFIIYSNSSMLLINPTISIWYSLYSIEYQADDKSTRKAMILSRSRFLEEGDIVKVKKISHKLYYSILEER